MRNDGGDNSGGDEKWLDIKDILKVQLTLEQHRGLEASTLPIENPCMTFESPIAQYPQGIGSRIPMDNKIHKFETGGDTEV